MRDILACLKARVFGNLRSTRQGLVLLAALVLFSLGADRIRALAAWLTAESDAVQQLLMAVDSGWAKLAGCGLVLWCLGRKDGAA